ASRACSCRRSRTATPRPAGAAAPPSASTPRPAPTRTGAWASSSRATSAAGPDGRLRRVRAPPARRRGEPARDGAQSASLLAHPPQRAHAQRRHRGPLVPFQAYSDELLQLGPVRGSENPRFGGGGVVSMRGALPGVVYPPGDGMVGGSLAIPVDDDRGHERELLRYGRVVSWPKGAWLG